MRGEREPRFWWAGIAFGVGSSVHLLDHLRRGQGSIAEALYWVGNLGLILQVALVTLIVVRHPRAPELAVPGGLALAVGFLGAHWLPTWGPVSDPIWEITSLPWLSGVASLAEIGGALAISVTGWHLLRAQDRTRTAAVPGARSRRRAEQLR